MKSVMTNAWKAPGVNIQRSSFDRSKGHKTTFNVDDLIPIYTDEVLPGDSVSMSVSAFTRLSTPIYPIMDNMQMTMHWFFVPMRLVWDNTENFFGEDLLSDGGGGNGNEPVKPLRTTQTGIGVLEGDLKDYMGIPVRVGGLPYDELPLRAYYLIWNEWYRSQDLQEKIPIDTSDLTNDWSGVPGFGLDTTPILKRNKRHDYFTSALPFPQKGPDITIPVVNPDIALANRGTDPFSLLSGTTTPLQTNSLGEVTTTVTPAGIQPLYANADQWNAESGTLNQLRTAFAVQRHFERDARGGTRYPEVLKAHFGVTSPDQRLQRPEYLGSNRASINITPVAATFENSAPTDSDRTVGDLGAMGTSNISGQRSFTKSFTEHGYLLGIMSVTADLTYQQGLHRCWNRETRFDYFWPTFAGIGEQPVYTREIVAGTAPSAPVSATRVFGYQERYAEYRYGISQISGEFRSDADTPLDAWHLSQAFTALPNLNDEFITSTTPIDRVVAVPSEPDFIGDFYFHTKWARPIPLFGVPGNIDRF